MTKISRNRRFALAAALSVAVLAFVPAANAGKGGGKPGGGGGGSSTLGLTLLNSTDGLAHYGQNVTFNPSTTATAYPSVAVNCYQSGTLVYTHSAGFYASYPWPWAQTFTLQSYAWTGGAANCTAKLYYMNAKGTSVTVATQSFNVYA